MADNKDPRDTVIMWLLLNGVIGMYQKNGEVLGHYIHVENGVMDIDLEEFRRLPNG
jgi:hypothetical protein